MFHHCLGVRVRIRALTPTVQSIFAILIQLKKNIHRMAVEAISTLQLERRSRIHSYRFSSQLTNGVRGQHR